MNTILEIIGKLMAAFVVGLLACLTPKAREWLEARTGKTAYDQLMLLVTSFARAAEQLYHDVDPTGERRKKFVMEQLRRLDVEITEAVMNMIEGAVWEINTETKKAQVQAKELTSGDAAATPVPNDLTELERCQRYQQEAETGENTEKAAD